MGAKAIGKLGEEAGKLGKKALVLVDQTLWDKLADEVQASLKQAGLDWKILFHSGHCSPKGYEKTKSFAVEMDADMLIGIGGGRLLDTAKIAAGKAKIDCIMVPTSASTCAASAWLAVEYTDDGAFVGNYWTEYPPFSTVIDTDIIVKKCPLRYNMAGIVDAMAKYPEIEYNIKFTNGYERNAFSDMAVETAKRTYQFFMEHFVELMEKFQKGIVDTQMEDAVAKAIPVTGLISSLACGGRQAAVAHLLYSYICCYHPEVATRYLHGEIVGASLCCQLLINGWDILEIKALQEHLHSADMPTSLTELGLNVTEKEINLILKYLKPRLTVSEDEIRRFQQIGALR